MTRISNLNNVSVRTYGQNSDTLAVIRELKKLGIIKSVAKAKGKPKPKMMDDLKQESDMVGYVKTLEGQSGRINPNIFSLRQIQPGMSEQEIQNLRERNNAGVAALRAEVQQQRLADIEAQQGQRFSDITRLGGIMNPILERFRGAQEPGAGQRTDPFEQSSTIFLPDIQEETFTQTINEGGPRAQPQLQTELFAEDEGEEGLTVDIPPARIAAQQRIIRKIGRNEYLQQNGLGPLPPNTKSTTLQQMRDYYDDFILVFGLDPDESLFTSKSGLYKDMVRKVDDLINLSV
jgi:hypothetical protein